MIVVHVQAPERLAAGLAVGAAAALGAGLLVDTAAFGRTVTLAGRALAGLRLPGRPRRVRLPALVPLRPAAPRPGPAGA